MKIGLITDSIERGSPGIRRYVSHLAEEMLKLAPDSVTLLYRGSGTDPFYAGKPQQRIWSPRASFVGKQLLFRLQIHRRGFHVLHDTYHFPPFLVPGPYTKVMTIHDLTPLILKSHTLRNRLAHRFYVRVLAHRADRVLTDSEHTRLDVIRLLGVNPDRVRAVPLAADESFRPVRDEERLQNLRERYSLPDKFLLCLGTIEPRKNLARVLEAFGAIAGAFPECALAVAGAQGWGNVGLPQRAAELGFGPRVRFLGHVPEDDLAALYSAATAFVYPSLYEGFGLPPLEAMQCGCPVITSNVSSLPEVAGDAALLVDPNSVEAIAGAMYDVLSNPSLRCQMQEKGLRQAGHFSWRRCAEQTLEAYEDARS